MPVLYPDSIAAAYVNESSTICGDNGPGIRPDAMLRRQRCYDSKVRALDMVLQAKCPRDRDPHADFTVVHLRLGDSFCATTVYASTALRPPPASEVVAVVRAVHERDRPCTLVYSSHGGCENETRAYVAEVVRSLAEDAGDMRVKKPKMRQEPHGGGSDPRGLLVPPPVVEEGVGWRDADRHFCAMANAKVKSENLLFDGLRRVLCLSSSFHRRILNAELRSLCRVQAASAISLIAFERGAICRPCSRWSERRSFGLTQTSSSRRKKRKMKRAKRRRPLASPPKVAAARLLHHPSRRWL